MKNTKQITVQEMLDKALVLVQTLWLLRLREVEIELAEEDAAAEEIDEDRFEFFYQ